MTTILIEKNGETMRINADSLEAHTRAGWRAVAASLDGMRLEYPDGGGVNRFYGPGIVPSLLVQHYQVTPVAVSATALHAGMALAAAARVVDSGLTNPDVARTVTIKGNVSGIAGNVVVHGRNILGQFISDTIALNGTAEVEGAKAFAEILRVNLPAQTNTPVAQVETATAVGTITGSGNAAVVVTAAGMTGSPKTLAVAVLENDTAAVWAGKVRAALAADAAVAALFDVSGEGAAIVLTRKIPAANDTTLNIALDNGTCTGITTAGTSANTTAGVPYDIVSLGIGKKFGLPQIVYHAACLLVKLFDGSADDGTLTVDDDEVEKNLFALDGTPDGEKTLDLFYIG